MKLKEIDIMGFKSFPNKTNVVFEDGVTAIVGPNGCGKSNISDAVKWVLGEQSVKSLRGSKMEDVIFSGTSKRKPLGYCEVTIVFDNSDGQIPIEYNEVAFTRRVFRSGESEYYINKNSCRLKDIRELLMDTGIGKEGYSVIGQGKIDEILSSKAEDRRHIFEEAAGIVKYKSKKEESERKLKRTEENLTRVNDLVHELKKQEKNLRIQSNKAKEYEEIYLKLKELEINKYLQDLSISHKLEEELVEKTLHIDSSIKDLDQYRQDYEAEISELEKELEALLVSLEDKKSKLFSLKEKISKEEGNLSVFSENQKFNNRDIERLELEKVKLETKKKELKFSNQTIEKEIEEKSLELEELLKKEELDSESLSHESLKIKDLEKSLEENKNKVMEIYNSISDKKSKLNSVISFKENIDNRNLQLRREMEAADLEIKQLTEAKSKGEGDIGKIKEDLEIQKLKSKELFLALNVAKDDLDDLNNRGHSLNVKLEGNYSNLRVFKNMEESYEGYYKGVKSVLKAKDNNPSIGENIEGVIAELIEVPSEFELAISTALGASSQNIVTKTQNSAKLVIDYLRKNKLGRATFLPLDTIRGNRLDLKDELRQEFKVLGLGSELVKYEEKYRNIIDSLLGRTVIVASMEDAIKLSNRFRNSLRIVTLDGGVINPGGSMSGGSQARQDNNLISRKNRILELEENIVGLKEEKTRVEFAYRDLLEKTNKDRQDYEKSLEIIKDLEYELFQKENLLKNSLRELERVDFNMKRSKEQLDSLSQEFENYCEEEISLKEDIEKLNQELSGIRAKILDIEKELELKNKIKLESLDSLTENKIVINKLKNSINNLDDRLNNNLELIGSYELELIKNLEAVEKLTLGLEEIEEKKKSFNLNISNYKEELENMEKLILNSEKTRDEKIVSLENLENRYKEKFGKLETYKDEKLKAQLEISKVRLKMENLNENLRAKYEMDYEEALEFEKDIEADQAEIKKYRNRLRSLGNVNLNSIEEYNQLRERLDFINSQREDLLEAEKDLLEVIDGMEKEMKALFVKTFREIDLNFQIIFKALFNGGEASLVLEDDQDILNSGIDIIASPPGKKSQNLASLSGGERSLVAVSLLFAILKIKPAPFCILDEIDAALDDANIGRYTEYLKQINKDTQFIIITHRKPTMEIADVLYGVTMEEKGVSKIVSMELKNNEEKISEVG